MEETLVAFLVVFVGIILVYLLIKLFRRKPCEDEHTNIVVPPLVKPRSGIQRDTDRLFTLSELKQAKKGRYNWDESGCVFEINSDGSVTVVGHFDPAELNIDPKQEIYDRLKDGGLIEMLPRMWCVIGKKNDSLDELILSYNDVIITIKDFHHTIPGIKEASSDMLAVSGQDDIPPIMGFLIQVTKPYIILLPSNETEYILSLGAKACLTREFGHKFDIKISSPPVMAALWTGVEKSDEKKSARITYAFGNDEDYQCCNLLMEDEVCEVKSILSSSIILPAEPIIALEEIAKGCLVQYCIQRGDIKGLLLLDMLPYAMSFLLKENGRIIKVYDLISRANTIPTRKVDKDITIGPTQTLSFLIGSNELIEDVITECNAPYGKIEATIEIDTVMNVTIIITSNGHDYRINIGELIGEKMGEKPKKYHITDEGDVFRINDDGSFTSMGNAEKMNEAIPEDTKKPEQTVHSSSKPEPTIPVTKSNSYKRYIIYGILFLILITGILIFIFLPFNSVKKSETIVHDTTVIKEMPVEIVSSEDTSLIQDIAMPITHDLPPKEVQTVATETKPNEQPVQTVQEPSPVKPMPQTKSQTSNVINPDKVYYSVEVQAEFPGGDRARKQWLRNNITWPRDANGVQLQGNVELEFIIERDGSISNVKVVYSENPELNSEAIRLISSMPDWSPAKVKNQPVRSPMGITLFF